MAKQSMKISSKIMYVGYILIGILGVLVIQALTTSQQFLYNGIPILFFPSIGLVIWALYVGYKGFKKK